MQALVLKELNAPLVTEQRSAPTPAKDEVVVQLRSSALNRRDYWITQGMYPGIKLPVVLGSDGAGEVVQIGSGLGNFWSNRQVIINPGWDWGSDERFQSESFRILGMPVDGTFASHVVVPADYLHEKPAHLSWHEAAAVPLAGVTAYRAVFTQGELKPNQNVLVNGVGGGVASFAMQYAIAAGANLFVTSSSSDKRDRAVAMGAKAAFNYADDQWHKEVKSSHGLMDLIIDSAGGEGYNALLELASPGGRIVNYGATAGPPKKIDFFKVFWKQLRIIGSSMGSPADFKSMLTFIAEQRIKPIIDEVLPLDSANAALAKMKTSAQFGKIVLDHNAAA
jgi:NADPH:quinone reductase-like Zn-dependent oxidoreductase